MIQATLEPTILVKSFSFATANSQLTSMVLQYSHPSVVVNRHLLAMVCYLAPKFEHHSHSFKHPEANVAVTHDDMYYALGEVYKFTLSMSLHYMNDILVRLRRCWILTKKSFAGL
jgi:hypothetical protein